MVVLLVLTVVNIVNESWKYSEDDDNLTVSLIQLVGICKEEYKLWGMNRREKECDS